MHHAGQHGHHLTDFENLGFLAHPLLDLPFEHVNDLLQLGVMVKIMALTGGQHGAVDLQILGMGDFRADHPVVGEAFEIFLHGFGLGEECGFFHKVE